MNLLRILLILGATPVTPVLLLVAVSRNLPWLGVLAVLWGLSALVAFIAPSRGGSPSSAPDYRD